MMRRRVGAGQRRARSLGPLQRWAVTAAVSVAGVLAWSSPSVADSDEVLARRAVSEDREEATRAIGQLRRRGRRGHAALMRVHAEAIEELRRRPRRTPSTARLRRAVDAVSAQRDGHVSGLYWHTDLDSARAEASRTGRPILSLRLLGRLDEEMSCANSRYFRLVLYSDPAVAAELARDWVLHWESERPAPRITIDMGDGRRIVRTITGNSVHYVLDAQGQPVDAIVGLYSPTAFRAAVAEARVAVESCAAADATNAGRPECLARHHREAGLAQRTAWTGLRQRAVLPTFESAVASLGAPPPPGPAPSATVAMPLTLSKARVETPILAVLGRPSPTPPAVEPDWLVAGVLAHGAAPLEAPARSLLRLKLGRADIARQARLLAESAIADGARNELLFRRRIHQWFTAQEPGTDDLEQLNRRVYAELLMTPADDPWLGLQADDLYDGIEVLEP